MTLKQKSVWKILIRKFKESNNRVLNLLNIQRGNLPLPGLPINSKWIQNNSDSWNLDDIWRNRMNLSGLYDAVFVSLSATYSLSKIWNKYEKNWWRLIFFQPSFSTLLEDLADLAVLKNSAISLKYPIIVFQSVFFIIIFVKRKWN